MCDIITHLQIEYQDQLAQDLGLALPDPAKYKIRLNMAIES
jgi:hypothetical protein